MDYGGEWSRVEEEVKGINRTNERWQVATARVHVVVSDRSVRKIGVKAFLVCRNLVKVMAPFVEEVGELAFEGAYNLCHVGFSPDIVIKPAYSICLSIEVLAASAGFELDTGDRWGSGNWNDATVGITRFVKWHNQMNDKKEYCKGAIVMLELAILLSMGTKECEQ